MVNGKQSIGIASTLKRLQFIMVRKTLIRASMLAYAVLILGRLLHLRLMLDRIHDVYTIYQTAWNTTKPIRALL